VDWDSHSGYSVSTAGDVNGDGLDDLIVGSFEADPSGKSKAGKSYVIFGKINNAEVNLSVVASGTGGFVINGENAGDLSGSSVSTAGDVNGDGLDDLIVGARMAKARAGKSYVIFGKNDTDAIDLSELNDDSKYITASKEPTIKSSKPSPLTSPAVETEKPLLSYAFSPLITKPPVPIADRLIAVLSVLPKMT
jgi:hypothetical protein